MELVYLWVEEYKNIYRQGFNFSPRFRYKYDPDTKDLIRCDKVDKDCKTNDKCKDFCDEPFIDNFFSNNINVTAIVGKNGTGKSSVLEVLENIFIDVMIKQYILIYRERDKNIVVSNIGSLPKDESSFPFNKYKILSLDNNHNYILLDNVISLNKSEIINKILYLDSNINFELTTFMYMPKKLKVDIKNIYKIFNDIKEKFSNKKVNIYDRSIITRMSLQSITDKYLQFLICLYYHYTYTIPNMLNSKTILDDLLTSFAQSNIKYPNKDEFNKFFINIDNAINDLSDEHKEFIKEYIDFFEIDFIDDKDRRYNHLSTGERNIFGEFINIFYYLKNGNNKIFLLDEADNALHPNWQKQYINELIIMLNKLNSSYDKLHFILTTHSPFLLSDIPKQNIIFLDTDDNGKCKVVDGLSQTFGANIHTLLSDSFFMEDGLMGEFAKGKIESIKKFYNKVIKYKDNDKVKKDYKCFYEKKQKEFWDIQSIIGEPFLQKIVKNQLEEIEFILFEEKAKEIAIKRFISEFGENAINEVMSNDKD